MVSIIIPIYNAEKWLNECLNSIVQQSYEDFEVLMVDDGSEDGSAAICQQIVERDNRFKYFYQQNAGVSVARNTGLEHATGEWVCFIDSDDMIDKHHLREMLKCSDQADAVWCDFSTELDGLGIKNKESEISKENLIRDIIFEKGKKPALWSLLYWRNIIVVNNLKFTPGCVRNEDYEFFMKYLVLCDKKLVKNGYVGYFYRQNPQSVMHQRRSLQSVLMSIEASSNVGVSVERVGIIPDKLWLTAFTVMTFLFIMCREKNIEIYGILHSRYPVKDFVRISLKHGSLRVKGAALLYRVLGRKLFYRLLSSYYSLVQTVNNQRSL